MGPHFLIDQNNAADARQDDEVEVFDKLQWFMWGALGMLVDTWKAAFSLCMSPMRLRPIQVQAGSIHEACNSLLICIFLHAFTTIQSRGKGADRHKVWVRIQLNWLFLIPSGVASLYDQMCSFMRCHWRHGCVREPFSGAISNNKTIWSQYGQGMQIMHPRVESSLSMKMRSTFCCEAWIESFLIFLSSVLSNLLRSSIIWLL